MGKKTYSNGLTDTTLLIVAFTAVFLYLCSAFMYVDSKQINLAQNLCKPHGGINRYYIHFVANKFDCKDGTQFEIRGN